jgi:hypothetical protein
MFLMSLMVSYNRLFWRDAGLSHYSLSLRPGPLKLGTHKYSTEHYNTENQHPEKN